MLESLVETYLEILDSGRDDPDLYEQIRHVSEQTGEPHWWDTVRVARELHLQKQALAIERSLLSKLPSLLENTETMSTAEGSTLSDYFNSLVRNNNLFWPRILREFGISPKQSFNFSRAKVPLTSLLTPQRLARLGKRLGADAATVLTLAKRELEAPVIPVSPQVSYRTLQGFRLPHPRNESTMTGESSALEYLARLEEYLNAEQC